MNDSFFFGPDTVTWQVHRDPSVIVGGLRALLVQAVHPRAMAGVHQHSDYRHDPWGRLERTSGFVLGTTFGTVAEAIALGEQVKAVHRRVEGTDPVTGADYRAQDPDLLAWVHNVMVDSFIRAKARYGGGLSPADADRYLSEMVRMAELVGTPIELVPTTVASLRAYLRSVPGLVVSDVAREAMMSLLIPPMPLRRRPLWGALTTAAVGLLPRRIRVMYGLPWCSAADPAVAAAMTAIVATLRVVGKGSPQLRRAQARAAA